MRHPRRLVALVALVVGWGGAVASCSTADDPGGSAALSSPAAAVSLDPAGPGVAATSFPGLVPATGEPTLPGIDSARPAAGRVEQVAGPFDDRFTLSRLRVGQGLVSGRIQVTSDVSDLLELQVLVGFYDTAGGFLGTGRTSYHLDESTAAPDDGPPSEVSDFRIAAPASYAGRVAGATVGVPVLVNE